MPLHLLYSRINGLGDRELDLKFGYEKREALTKNKEWMWWTLQIFAFDFMPGDNQRWVTQIVTINFCEIIILVNVYNFHEQTFEHLYAESELV